MSEVKLYTIGFVTDPSLSREKTQVALRAIHGLRSEAEIRYFPGNLTESELLERVEREPLDLLLVPWHMYLGYQKLEAHFGLSRTEGPTVAGWFAEDFSPYELEQQDHSFRAIFIDLNRLRPNESMVVLRSLLRDTTRWGLKPFLSPQTPLHFETWNSQLGLGFRIDTILVLPEIQNSQWIKRANSLRVIVSALWSLVFDQGPGKADTQKSAGTLAPPRGYFEIGADNKALGFRLCYTEPGWRVKDILHQFWPGGTKLSGAGQILTHYSDLFRVHVDPETSEVEIVCILFHSAPSESATDVMRTLWIEPLNKSCRFERFTEDPLMEEPFHKALVTHHNLIGNAAELIDNLKGKVEDQTKEIETLKTKGVTKENIFIYPAGFGGEQLLELFNRRIMENSSKLKSLQHQQSRLNLEKSADASESARLSKDARQLSVQKKNWLVTLRELYERLAESNGVDDPDQPLALSALPELPPETPTTPEEEEAQALAAAGTQERTALKRPHHGKKLKKAG